MGSVYTNIFKTILQWNPASWWLWFKYSHLVITATFLWPCKNSNKSLFNNSLLMWSPFHTANSQQPTATFCHPLSFHPVSMATTTRKPRGLYISNKEFSQCHMRRLPCTWNASVAVNGRFSKVLRLFSEVSSIFQNYCLCIYIILVVQLREQIFS